MKYLLVLLAVVLVAWQWRSTRRQRQLLDRNPPTTTATTSATVEMVECKHCGIHLAAAESVPGQRGSYCSEAHRDSAENVKP